MPEAEKSFEQLKDAVEVACWEGDPFDFASHEGKVSAEQMEELKKFCEFKSTQRKSYDAGRAGEECDFSVLEVDWSTDDIDSFKLMHRRGMKRPIDDHEAFKSDTYHLGEKIGSGAFGTVYKGFHVTLRRPVAIKIQKSLLNKMSIKEARLAVKVRSPNIVGTENVGELEDGRSYLVMEWIEGQTLQERIRRGIGEDEPLGRRWMQQCCRGMMTLEEKGIIHRDLKPANLFLDQNVIKIGDFGLAKQASTSQASPAGADIGQSSAASSPKKVDFSATLTSSVTANTFRYTGTPHYMAPEHWDGKAEKRSDIYSFGATFYEVFTGQPPFDEPVQEELWRKHKKVRPEEPISLNPDLSAGTSSLIMRCLEKDPADRFQSFEEILDDIQGIQKEAEKGQAASDLSAALAEAGIIDEELTRKVIASIQRKRSARVAERRRQDAATLRKQAGEYREAGDLEQAIRQFTNALRLKPDDVAALSARGETYLFAEHFGNAIDDFNKVLKLDPLNSVNWYYRGIAHAQQKEFTRAIEDYDEALRLNPRSAATWYWKGRAHSENGEPDQAFKDYREGLRIDPDDADLLHALAYAYYEKGEYDLAIEYYDKAIAIDPREVYYHWWLGICHAQKGDFFKAIEIYDNAIELKHDLPDCWYSRGRALISTGRLKEAMESFDRAINIDPEIASFRHYRGFAYVQLGDLIRGLEEYNEAIRLETAAPQGYHKVYLFWQNRGLLHQQLGNEAEAQADFKRAKELGYTGVDEE